MRTPVTVDENDGTLTALADGRLSFFSARPHWADNTSDGATLPAGFAQTLEGVMIQYDSKVIFEFTDRLRAEYRKKTIRQVMSQAGAGDQGFCYSVPKLLLHFPFCVLFRHTCEPRQSVPTDSVYL